jgi:hypothetical protein
MEIEQVRADIESWIENFLEVPHPALGGFSPCPYARAARLKKSYAVYLGVDPYYDLKNRSSQGMGSYEVVIYAYDPAEWSHELFASSLDQANQEFLFNSRSSRPHNSLKKLNSDPSYCHVNSSFPLAGMVVVVMVPMPMAKDDGMVSVWALASELVTSSEK